MVKKTTPPARNARSKHAQARDVETNARLLESATRLFSERGFYNVTVRDIAHEAGANLAAVSYHFGDKLGLYTAVVDSVLSTIRVANDKTMLAATNASAEDKLRHYVREYLPLIIDAASNPARSQTLMHHEMNEPTPAARMIAERVILPRMKYLSDVIAELMGCGPADERVALCVFSLQAQCLFYAPDRFKSAAFPGWPPTDKASVDAAVNHIVAFSLGGIRSLITKGNARKRRNTL